MLDTLLGCKLSEILLKASVNITIFENLPIKKLSKFDTYKICIYNVLFVLA